jgi:hypothetical protein
MNAPVEEAEAHAKVSVRENRVYAGNLSYSTTYKDLEKFCQQGGWTWISLDVNWSVGCGQVRKGDGCRKWNVTMAGAGWWARGRESQLDHLEPVCHGRAIIR